MKDGDDALDLKIADMKNCTWGTAPDAWAHLDIAGTAVTPAATDRPRTQRPFAAGACACWPT